MDFTVELVIIIAVQIFGMGATSGAILWRIKALEKKQDKHNKLFSRVATNEVEIAGLKSDGTEEKGDIKQIKKDVSEIKLTCARREKLVL